MKIIAVVQYFHSVLHLVLSKTLKTYSAHSIISWSPLYKQTYSLVLEKEICTDFLKS